MKVAVPHARLYYATGFGLVVLAAVTSVVMALRATEAEELVGHTFRVREVASRLLSEMQAAEASEQGFLLTSNPSYLAAFQACAAQVPATLAELRQMTADNPAQTQNLPRLKTVADARLNVLGTNIALAQNGGRDQAIEIVRFDRGRELMGEFNTLLGDFSQTELDLLATRQAAAEALRRWLLVMVCASLAGAVALAGFLLRTASETMSGLRTRTAELEAEVKLRHETEAKLRQSQKLELVGHLTGGIAHDFNNLLTVVLGNLDTLRRRMANIPADQDIDAFAASLMRPIDSAMRGAQNAAQLIHRLLAFSRRQTLEPKRLDLNQLVSGIADLLRRTLGEKITLEAVLAGGLWPALADANQVESALMNLCVNARDAMPDGGHLTVETGNAYLDEAYARQFDDVTAGQYVLLMVTDTGVGIAPDVLEHVFEPFFTTKRAGEGSGLGLAMVHGFVKQSGGHIRIYSEVGHGTTVKIYLPRLAQSAAVAPAAKVDETPVPHAAPGHTVLVVEDNAGVRAYARSALEELGYHVLEAADGSEAFRIIEEPTRIDLLFTDVVLPGINGRELADKAVQRRADMQVLYTTGYTRNAIVHDGRLDPDVHLLSKPYTQQSLARKVQELLGARSARRP